MAIANLCRAWSQLLPWGSNNTSSSPQTKISYSEQKMLFTLSLIPKCSYGLTMFYAMQAQRERRGCTADGYYKCCSTVYVSFADPALAHEPFQLSNCTAQGLTKYQVIFGSCCSVLHRCQISGRISWIPVGCTTSTRSSLYWNLILRARRLYTQCKPRFSPLPFEWTTVWYVVPYKAAIIKRITIYVHIRIQCK